MHGSHLHLWWLIKEMLSVKRAGSARVEPTRLGLAQFLTVFLVNDLQQPTRSQRVIGYQIDFYIDGS